MCAPHGQHVMLLVTDQGKAVSACVGILTIIAAEVKACFAGNEIRSVIMHGDRFSKYPIGKIDGTYTWKVCSVPRLGTFLSSTFVVYSYSFRFEFRRRIAAYVLSNIAVNGL